MKLILLICFAKEFEDFMESFRDLKQIFKYLDIRSSRYEYYTGIINKIIWKFKVLITTSGFWFLIFKSSF